MTRLARETVDDNEAEAYREARAELLAEHDYTARVREEEHDVLVVHPEEWVEDGTVYPERIDDIERGIERPLSGPGDPDDWEEVWEHNMAIAEEVEREHGSAHGGNAEALAEFMSNHYAKRIDQATESELEEFVEEYYPRNVWPTDDQKAVVEESVELVVELTQRR
ncbi:rnhA operon protein [Halovenus sp. WSH3]|uniref:RnhA operon protein n=1 Tax=Halovenus carboxidivorans TaxID=2692199 RepID=A0A6B0SZ16_9EURY|nr:rnhA operon protein [Halovenus carboxidivorans]